MCLLQMCLKNYQTKTKHTHKEPKNEETYTASQCIYIWEYNYEHG